MFALVNAKVLHQQTAFVCGVYYYHFSLAKREKYVPVIFFFTTNTKCLRRNKLFFIFVIHSHTKQSQVKYIGQILAVILVAIKSMWSPLPWPSHL